MGEVGLEVIKKLAYGGIIFYMLIGNDDYLSYGDCVYVNIGFLCTSQLTGATLGWFPCYTPEDGLVGCYTPYPGATCLTSAVVIPGGSEWYVTATGSSRSIEDIFTTFNNKICQLPNGTIFSTVNSLNLTSYDPLASRDVGACGELQCRIGFHVARLAIAAVLILLIAVLFDELWGLLDENWISSIWSKYIRIPSYIVVVVSLMLGLLLTAVAHISWISYPPQSQFGNSFFPTTEYPCSSPTRIAVLMTLLSFLLLVTEVSEAIYHIFGSHEKVE